MKTFIILTTLMTSVSSFACIPAGSLLVSSEKKAFIADLAEKNPKCSSDISKKIGKLTSERTSVFEEVQDNLVIYSVTGLKGKMKIEKIKVMGKIQYMCSPVTGLTRGC